MISDEIAAAADRLLGYGAKRRAMEPEVAATLAAHLAYLASRVAMLETLEFVVPLVVEDRKG
jgi:hypothetical protein